MGRVVPQAPFFNETKGCGVPVRLQFVEGMKPAELPAPLRDEMALKRHRAGLGRRQGLSLHDALPPKTLAKIAEKAAAWKIGQRRKNPQLVWRYFVEEATDNPWNLGTVVLPEGGLPVLADAWGLDGSTLWRTIGRWERKGLVSATKGAGGRRVRPTVAVEIPLLADHLVWLSWHRLRILQGSESDLPTMKQVYALLWDALERQVLPYGVETYEDAQALVARLREAE